MSGHRLRAPVGVRLLLVSGAFAAAAPAPASALDVRPSSCHVRLDQVAQMNVYTTDNPNPDVVEIPYGPQNIVLQAPNFRAGQPTLFPPGRSEGLWATRVHAIRQPNIDWYLQGVVAGNGDLCAAPGAPRNVVAPSITGTPSAGETVTLDPGAWTGGSIVRQAYRIDVCDRGGCAPHRPENQVAITGPSAYVIPPELRGRRLRLTVAAYSTRGVATAASAVTAPIGSDGTPASPTTSRVPGTADRPIPVIGDRATVPPTQQVWNGVPAPEVAHQWQRCSPACADIPDDTGLAHRVVAADVGTSLRVVTTADNGEGAATWTSMERPITEVPSATAPPVPLVSPRLSGTAGVGLPLAAEVGSWAGDDAPDVQWQRCDAGACTDIPGATAESYTPVDADAGLRLRAVVAGQNGDVPTSGFAPALHPAATDLSAPVTTGPVNVRPPAIAGTADVGAELRVDDTGSWSAPLESATTSWERCRGTTCEPIAGASADRYAPTAADAGTDIRAVVTARTADGATRAASAPIGLIGSVRAAAAPSIAGDAVAGGDLLATLGDWVGTPLPAVSAQWLRCDAAGGACTELVGATGALYRPNPADVGRTLRVRARASNAFSADERVSAPTAAVRPAPGPPAPAVPAPGEGGSRAPSSTDREVDRIAPRLTAVRLSRKRFRVARAAMPLAARARRGSKLNFRLSEAAWLRIDVRRTGRRRAPRGTLTRVARAGAGRLAFSGRLGKKALPPGRYVMTVRATDVAGNRSRARKVRFRIVR